MQTSESTNDPGLGTGLALVHRLVSLHGGQVFARSDGRGEGSVFMVRLPLLQGASQVPTHVA